MTPFSAALAASTNKYIQSAVPFALLSGPTPKIQVDAVVLAAASGVVLPDGI